MKSTLGLEVSAVDDGAYESNTNQSLVPPYGECSLAHRVQQGELEKVGATSPVKVDVRFVAATHRNVQAMIDDGTFREDLYYACRPKASVWKDGEGVVDSSTGEVQR
jgi:hypothetical protein